MPSLLLFVPTESLSIDQGSNRLSLFNVLEQINVANFPARLAQICLVTLWQRDRNESKDEAFGQIIDLRDPDGMSLCPPRLARFTMPKKRHRLVSIIGNVEIHRAGQHEIRLYGMPPNVDAPEPKYLLRSFPLEVRQIHHPTAQRPPLPADEE
jgi:hypothetical protein